MSRETPYNPPIRRKKRGNGRLFMIGLSTVLHGVAIAGILTFSGFSAPDFQPDFAISVAEVPLRATDLPAIDEGNREAGAPSSQPEQPIEEAVAEFNPETEEDQPEESQPEQQPESEPEEQEQPAVETEPETEPETPVREEQPKPKSDPKPQPVEEQPEQRTVSPNTRPAERQEPEPEPEPAAPTPEEVASELQQRSGTFSRTKTVGGTTQRRMIAGESDPGGGGGAGLYRSVLIGRIAQFWDPPFTRRGEVRDCLVEFTIYSPPLPSDAVNQIRTSRVTNLRLLNSSGDPQFDARALDAVRRVQNWPPLPDSYKKETLVVQCRFYLIGEGS